MKLLSSRLSLNSSSLAIAITIATTTAAKAQIIPDGTLPNNTVVNIEGNLHRITGGTTVNNNLFHSFQEFSLPTDRSALFDNPSTINNIFSRVTGGKISDLDGTIRANGNANLFLINPSGIVFGPNARLNIGGSFIGSTAESVIFDNGSFFSASNPEAPPLLTVNVPIGLQMGNSPGEIAIAGPGHDLEVEPETGVIKDNNALGLQVAPGQSLTLLGGNVTLDGANLKAEGGRVEIASLGGGDRATLAPTESGFELGYAGASNFGNIRLLNAAAVNGSSSARLRGRNISLDDGSIILARIMGAEAGGTLILQAVEAVEIIGTDNSGVSSGLYVNSAPTATGNGGSIIVSANALSVAEGGKIVTATSGSGNAGSITVRATDSVELRGTSAGGSSSGLLAGVLDANATGNGGSVAIVTSRLRVTDGAQIGVASLGAGNAGSAIVEATESVEIIGTAPDGSQAALFAGVLSPMGVGSGGNVTISTPRLLIADGGQIVVATDGSGDGGSLSVRANDVEIIGTSPRDGSDRSGIFAGVSENGKGDGGDVRIVTSRLRVVGGGTLEVSTEGIGNAGELSVEAREFVEIGGEPGDIGVREELENLNLALPEIDSQLLEIPSVESIVDRPGILAGTISSGDGGNVRIVTPRLRLHDRAIILVGTTGSGLGGNATISTSQLEIANGSGIVAPSFGSGNAGELTVAASDRLELSGDSVLGAGTNSLGNAGSINIQGGELRVRDRATVTVVARGTGNPGSIAVTANEVLLDDRATLAATSATGKGGNISLRSPEIQLRRGSSIAANGSSTGNITLEGNININVDTLVLLQGSRIITDAESPQGGSNIAIAPLSDLLVLQSPDSIIDAVGELQIATGIEIQPPESPELEVTDVADAIARDLCSPEARQSSFTIVGKGGLPPNPAQPLTDSRPTVEWAAVDEERSLISEPSSEQNNYSTTEAPFVEATGWIVTPEGNLLLVADASLLNRTNPTFTHPSCP